MFWKSQNYWEGEQITGSQGLGSVTGIDYKESAFWGVIELFCILLWWLLHNCLHLLINITDKAAHPSPASHPKKRVFLYVN